MVRQIAIKFCTVTNFDPLKPSEKFDLLKTEMADSHCPKMPMVDVLNATQQGTEPIQYGCRPGCILVPPGKYD